MIEQSNSVLCPNALRYNNKFSEFRSKPLLLTRSFRFSVLLKNSLCLSPVGTSRGIGRNGVTISRGPDFIISEDGYDFGSTPVADPAAKHGNGGLIVRSACHARECVAYDLRRIDDAHELPHAQGRPSQRDTVTGVQCIDLVAHNKQLIRQRCWLISPNFVDPPALAITGIVHGHTEYRHFLFWHHHLINAVGVPQPTCQVALYG